MGTESSARATNTLVNTPTLRFAAVPLAVVALALSAVGCGDDSDDDSSVDGGSVTVTEVWIREPAEGQPNSAAYGIITNQSGEEITLVGVTAPVTGTIEIHETIMGADDTMSMQERENGFDIPDGESLTLEPGGAHVMMLGIDPTQFTEGFDLTFMFDGTDSVTVSAEIRVLPGSDETESADTDSSES